MSDFSIVWLKQVSGRSGRVRVPMATIDQRTALGVLTKLRLLEITASLGLGLPGRDELRAICRAAGIDDSGRAKAVIVDRLLGRRQDGTRDTWTKADLIDTITAEADVLNKDAEVIVSTALAAMVYFMPGKALRQV